MILDIQTIKHSLMDISKTKPDSKGFINYSNFVNKTLSKADTLLKLIQFTPDQLALNYADFAKK
jgi:vacuolar protein sorting-associated protein 53